MWHEGEQAQVGMSRSANLMLCHFLSPPVERVQNSTWTWELYKFRRAAVESGRGSQPLKSRTHCEIALEPSCRLCSFSHSVNRECDVWFLKALVCLVPSPSAGMSELCHRKLRLHYVSITGSDDFSHFSARIQFLNVDVVYLFDWRRNECSYRGRGSCRDQGLRLLKSMLRRVFLLCNEGLGLRRLQCPFYS